MRRKNYLRLIKKGIIGTAVILAVAGQIWGCSYREPMDKEEMENRKKDIYNLPAHGSAGNNKTNGEAVTEEPESIDYTGFIQEGWLCYGDTAEYSHSDMFGENSRISLKVNSVEIYNEVEDMPEYFAKSCKEDTLSYPQEIATDENGNDIRIEGEDIQYEFVDEETVYLLVNVSIKNQEQREAKNVSVSNFRLCKLVEDTSGKDAGVTTSEIREKDVVNTEKKYDYAYKKQGNWYYFFDLKAGEEITTNICWRMAKKELVNALYLCNGEYNGFIMDGINLLDQPCAERKYIRLVNLKQK